MAAGAFTVYSNAALGLTKGAMNLATDTLVMVLLTSSYTPAPDTNTHWSDISANEVATGSGYTQGGVVLTQTDTLSGGTVKFTASPATWAAPFTAAFKYAVIVRRAGASLVGTDLLVAYCDGNSGGGNVTLGGGALTITPDAAGIFSATHTP